MCYNHNMLEFFIVSNQHIASCIMIIRSRALFFEVVLLVNLTGVTSCSHSSAPIAKKTDAGSSLEFEVNRLYLDINRAQAIERRDSGEHHPEEPIFYEYGTDSHHRAYRFANLRAFRLDIKHRIDSLQVAGRVISYDTMVTGKGAVGKMIVD